MDRQTLRPASKEEWLKLRLSDITSTECAALFGLSPYSTPYKLWHAKHCGVVEEFAENERMKWGLALQGVVAEEFTQQQGISGYRLKDEYVRLTDLRLGSSFDYELTGDGALLEIKTVDSLVYAQKWTETEAPPHIELQVQHQLLVSGAPYAYIVALVGGNKLVSFRRDPQPDIHARIMAKAAEFWAATEPPEPTEADSKFIIKRLCTAAQPGKVIEATSIALDESVAEYNELNRQKRDLEKRLEHIKAGILAQIGDAEKVTGNGYTISAGLVGPADVSYHRDGYRSFKVTVEK